MPDVRISNDRVYPVRLVAERQFVRFGLRPAREFPAVVDHDREEIRICRMVPVTFLPVLISWAEASARKTCPSSPPRFAWMSGCYRYRIAE